MIKSLSLELIREIDCKDMQNIKLHASSYNKLYQINFDRVLNFNYSIEQDTDLSSDGLDIIDINYIYDFPTKKSLMYYSYSSDKSLLKKKLHYLFIYGELELVIISKEMTILKLGDL